MRVKSQVNLPDVEGTLLIEYLIDANGQIDISYSLKIDDQNTPEIPCVGMNMELFVFDRLQYFGRGPHETIETEITLPM